jgi:hypothetical protein
MVVSSSIDKTHISNRHKLTANATKYSHHSVADRGYSISLSKTLLQNSADLNHTWFNHGCGTPISFWQMNHTIILWQVHSKPEQMAVARQWLCKHTSTAIKTCEHSCCPPPPPGGGIPIVGSRSVATPCEDSSKAMSSEPADSWEQ